MARPKSSEKLNKRIQICVTVDQKKHIEEIASERDFEGVSDMVRLDYLKVKPKRKKPTESEEALLKGVAALQQISKNFEQVKGVISDDIMRMMRTEFIAVGQLITKGLKK
ncbi:hypothetical protein [Dyadobacter sp. CY356]|uniref:hypothetical protein n=1 Tax=Dyadobacter sp. CY356 TaxID=2906442 RepID=UPI001F40F21B|nr:hypothetical protein [Dyadobacter sp. CY356]MCF0055494.1 hypothetical protein [Dyadobacter sp. CY356]